MIAYQQLQNRPTQAPATWLITGVARPTRELVARQ